MKTLFQLFITFYLVVFSIGGGRVCGCNLLEISGIGHCSHSSEQHDHFSDHCHHDEELCSDHGRPIPSDDEHSPNDCCELLTPIEADLPRILEVPDVDEFASIGAAALASGAELYQLNLAFKKWYFPPPDDWETLSCFLPVLQRFLV